MRAGCFTIYRTANDTYSFVLADPAGQPILHSSNLASYMSAVNTIIMVKGYSETMSSYEKTDIREQHCYFFELTGSLNKVLGASEVYASREDRDVAIEAVRQTAPGAAIEELI